MMAQRQLEFRQTCRARVAGWYNGHVHVLVIYSIGLMAIYLYTRHIDNVVWWEWLTIPAVGMVCNFFLWFLHQRIMHRPQTRTDLRAIYECHTLNHHRFFTDSEMRFRDNRDWRVTFFPPYALVIFILMSLPGGLLLAWLVTPNVGMLMICTTTGMYLIYEFMHFCCHVDENWFVRYCPMVNTLRRHHTAHHNNRLMMEVNMNLTFPIADWLLGTSDLDRGLLGHLFNGYSTRHLKPDLKERPVSPAVAAARPLGAE